MLMRIIVSERSPDAAGIERAAAVIRAGGLVAFPTDTLYGLAADPFNADAVARVFAAKGRGAERALPLIAADEAQIARQLGRLPPLAGALAERFWPGPLTLLIAAPPTLAAAVTGGTGRVGVRVPAHDVARALCRASDSVLTATSANLSGDPATDDPDAVAASLGEQRGRARRCRSIGRRPAVDDCRCHRIRSCGWSEQERYRGKRSKQACVAREPEAGAGDRQAKGGAS